MSWYADVAMRAERRGDVSVEQQCLAQVQRQGSSSSSALRAVDRQGLSAAHWAARFGHVQSLRQLLDAHEPLLLAGDHAGELPLHAAARFGRAAAVALLLARGAPVDAGSGSGERALHVAEDEAAVRELLMARPTVDVRDRIDRTPLAVAAAAGNVPVARLLLDRGADVHARCAGQSLIEIAAVAGHVAMAALLVEKGADPETRASHGRTALYWARNGETRAAMQKAFKRRTMPSLHSDSLEHEWQP